VATKLDSTKKLIQRVLADGRVALSRGLKAFDGPPGVASRLRRIRELVTPLGLAVVVLGIATWVAGVLLGWHELMIVAALCLLLVLVGIGFIVGRSNLQTKIVLDPPRVGAGDASAGQVLVNNPAPRRAAPAQIELPIGAEVVVFDCPALGPGEVKEELFVIHTERRGVVTVGPATSARSDPLGLFQRKASSSEQLELIVHPRTVWVEPFGSGLLRDLEGITTKDLSASDLAFHALREYVPGDDRRHIHWRSSAKAGQLLVRQYLDTKRSTLCVLVDAATSAYGDSEEFECALQVAGSIALRACRDGIPAVLAAGRHAATGVVPHAHLDALARAELESKSPELLTLARRASLQSADVSIAVIISGSIRRVEDLDRAGSQFPPDVGLLGIRVVPEEVPRVTLTPRGVVAQLHDLRDLPALLKKDLAA